LVGIADVAASPAASESEINDVLVDEFVDERRVTLEQVPGDRPMAQRSDTRS